MCWRRCTTPTSSSFSTPSRRAPRRSDPPARPPTDPCTPRDCHLWFSRAAHTGSNAGGHGSKPAGSSLVVPPGICRSVSPQGCGRAFTQATCCAARQTLLSVRVAGLGIWGGAASVLLEAPGSAPAQDADWLYLVMDYLPGGDVMVRWRPSPLFPEPCTPADGAPGRSSGARAMSVDWAHGFVRTEKPENVRTSQVELCYHCYALLLLLRAQASDLAVEESAAEQCWSSEVPVRAAWAAWAAGGGRGGADAADAQGHPQRGDDAVLHRGDGPGPGVHPPPQLHSSVTPPAPPSPRRGRYWCRHVASLSPRRSLPGSPARE